MRNAKVMVISLLILMGCSTYDYRQRPDNSGEVVIIKNYENVVPTFAGEFKTSLDGLAIPKLANASLGHLGYETEIKRLYEIKDQLNAQVRDVIVLRYQSYINSQLDTNLARRNSGDADWNSAILHIHDGTNALRKAQAELSGINQSTRREAEAEKAVQQLKNERDNAKLQYDELLKQLQMAEAQGRDQSQMERHTPPHRFPPYSINELMKQAEEAQKNYQLAEENYTRSIENLRTVKELDPGQSLSKVLTDLQQLSDSLASVAGGGRKLRE
jgi:hypothetical protein